MQHLVAGSVLQIFGSAKRGKRTLNETYPANFQPQIGAHRLHTPRPVYMSEFQVKCNDLARQP